MPPPGRIIPQPLDTEAVVDPVTGRITYRLRNAPQLTAAPQFRGMGLPEAFRSAAADVPQTPVALSGNRITGGPTPLEALGATNIPFQAAGDVAYEGTGSPLISALTQAGLNVASPGAITRGARVVGQHALGKLPGALEGLAGKMGTQMYAVKPRGGQWIEPDLSSLIPNVQPLEWGSKGEAIVSPIDQYVNKNLRRWIKTSMGTTETDDLARELGLGISPETGQHTFDSSVNVERAGDFIPENRRYMHGTWPGSTFAQQAEANPWIGKMQPDEAVHSMGSTPEPLTQMMDYLRTVPAEKLKSIAVPDALRQSKAYHDALAKKQTDAALSAGSLKTHREYPEGFKWQEIVAPEKSFTAETLPEGHTLKRTPSGKWGVDSTIGWQATGETPEEALRSYSEMHNREMLSQGLDAEGQMMGHCLASGSLVRTYTGYRPIEQISVGERVLTQSGRFLPVTRTFKRDHDGEVIHVRTRKGHRGFLITLNHEVFSLVCHRQRKDPCWKESCSPVRSPRFDVQHEAAWVPVGDLDPRVAYFAVAHIDESEIKDIEEINGYAIDDEFLWVLGMYIAEGSAESGRRIQFSLSNTEPDRVERIKAFFENRGISVRECQGRSERQIRRIGRPYKGTVLRVYNADLARWWDSWVGHGCANKHIPNELMFLPGLKIASLLRGIMDGDGHWKRNSLGQTSRVLADQFVELSIRLGGQPTIGAIRMVDGKLPSFTIHKAFPVLRNGDTNRHVTAFGQTFVSAHTFDREDYVGPVYNLEVAEDHTYVVDGVVVHNCVGSYCDQVSGGGTRIFSLRDASGKPHVTVEVQPERSSGTDQLNKFRAQAAEELRATGKDPESAAFGTLVNQRAEQLRRENPVMKIQQIKGKQNAAPVESYLPYVQDFVRNSPLGAPWGDVRDIGNAGMVHIRDPRSVRMGEMTEGGLSVPEVELPAGSYAHQDMINTLTKGGLSEKNAQDYAAQFFNLSGVQRRGGHAAGGRIGFHPQHVEQLVNFLNAP